MDDMLRSNHDASYEAIPDPTDEDPAAKRRASLQAKIAQFNELQQRRRQLMLQHGDSLEDVRDHVDSSNNDQSFIEVIEARDRIVSGGGEILPPGVFSPPSRKIRRSDRRRSTLSTISSDADDDSAMHRYSEYEPGPGVYTEPPSRQNEHIMMHPYLRSSFETLYDSGMEVLPANYSSLERNGRSGSLLSGLKSLESLTGDWEAEELAARRWRDSDEASTSSASAASFVRLPARLRLDDLDRNDSDDPADEEADGRRTPTVAEEEKMEEVITSPQETSISSKDPSDRPIFPGEAPKRPKPRRKPTVGKEPERKAITRTAPQPPKRRSVQLDDVGIINPAPITEDIVQPDSSQPNLKENRKSYDSLGDDLEALRRRVDDEYPDSPATNGVNTRPKSPEAVPLREPLGNDNDDPMSASSFPFQQETTAAFPETKGMRHCDRKAIAKRPSLSEMRQRFESLSSDTSGNVPAQLQSDVKRRQTPRRPSNDLRASLSSNDFESRGSFSSQDLPETPESTLHKRNSYDPRSSISSEDQRHSSLSSNNPSSIDRHGRRHPSETRESQGLRRYEDKMRKQPAVGAFVQQLGPEVSTDPKRTKFHAWSATHPTQEYVVNAATNETQISLDVALKQKEANISPEIHSSTFQMITSDDRPPPPSYIIDTSMLPKQNAEEMTEDQILPSKATSDQNPPPEMPSNSNPKSKIPRPVSKGSISVQEDLLHQSAPNTEKPEHSDVPEFLENLDQSKDPISPVSKLSRIPRFQPDKEVSSQPSPKASEEPVDEKMPQEFDVLPQSRRKRDKPGKDISPSRDSNDDQGSTIRSHLEELGILAPHVSEQMIPQESGENSSDEFMKPSEARSQENRLPVPIRRTLSQQKDSLPGIYHGNASMPVDDRGSKQHKENSGSMPQFDPPPYNDIIESSRSFNQESLPSGYNYPENNDPISRDDPSQSHRRYSQDEQSSEYETLQSTWSRKPEMTGKKMTADVYPSDNERSSQRLPSDSAEEFIDHVYRSKNLLRNDQRQLPQRQVSDDSQFSDGFSADSVPPKRPPHVAQRVNSRGRSAREPRHHVIPAMTAQSPPPEAYSSDRHRRYDDSPVRRSDPHAPRREPGPPPRSHIGPRISDNQSPPPPLPQRMKRNDEKKPRLSSSSGNSRPVLYGSHDSGLQEVPVKENFQETSQLPDQLRYDPRYFEQSPRSRGTNQLNPTLSGSADYGKPVKQPQKFDANPTEQYISNLILHGSNVPIRPTSQRRQHSQRDPNSIPNQRQSYPGHSDANYPDSRLPEQYDNVPQNQFPQSLVTDRPDRQNSQMASSLNQSQPPPFTQQPLSSYPSQADPRKYDFKIRGTPRNDGASLPSHLPPNENLIYPGEERFDNRQPRGIMRNRYNSGSSSGEKLGRSRNAPSEQSGAYDPAMNQQFPFQEHPSKNQFVRQQPIRRRDHSVPSRKSSEAAGSDREASIGPRRNQSIQNLYPGQMQPTDQTRSTSKDPENLNQNFEFDPVTGQFLPVHSRNQRSGNDLRINKFAPQSQKDLIHDDTNQLFRYDPETGQFVPRHPKDDKSAMYRFDPQTRQFVPITPREMNHSNMNDPFPYDPATGQFISGNPKDHAKEDEGNIFRFYPRTKQFMPVHPKDISHGDVGQSFQYDPKTGQFIPMQPVGINAPNRNSVFTVDPITGQFIPQNLNEVDPANKSQQIFQFDPKSGEFVPIYLNQAPNTVTRPGESMPEQSTMSNINNADPNQTYIIDPLTGHFIPQHPKDINPDNRRQTFRFDPVTTRFVPKDMSRDERNKAASSHPRSAQSFGLPTDDKNQSLVYDPNTGKYLLNGSRDPASQSRRVDPRTGKPVQPSSKQGEPSNRMYLVDPKTGQYVTHNTMPGGRDQRHNIDPQSGRLMPQDGQKASLRTENQNFHFYPMTGQFIPDSQKGSRAPDRNMNFVVDPKTGQFLPLQPNAMDKSDKHQSLMFDPLTGQFIPQNANDLSSQMPNQWITDEDYDNYPHDWQDNHLSSSQSQPKYSSASSHSDPSRKARSRTSQGSSNPRDSKSQPYPFSGQFRGEYQPNGMPQLDRSHPVRASQERQLHGSPDVRSVNPMGTEKLHQNFPDQYPGDNRFPSSNQQRFQQPVDPINPDRSNEDYENLHPQNFANKPLDIGKAQSDDIRPQQAGALNSQNPLSQQQPIDPARQYFNRTHPHRRRSRPNEKNNLDFSNRPASPSKPPLPPFEDSNKFIDHKYLSLGRDPPHHQRVPEGPQYLSDIVVPSTTHSDRNAPPSHPAASYQLRSDPSAHAQLVHSSKRDREGGTAQRATKPSFTDTPRKVQRAVSDIQGHPPPLPPKVGGKVGRSVSSVAPSSKSEKVSEEAAKLERLRATFVEAERRIGQLGDDDNTADEKRENFWRQMASLQRSEFAWDDTDEWVTDAAKESPWPLLKDPGDIDDPVAELERMYLDLDLDREDLMERAERRVVPDSLYDRFVQIRAELPSDTKDAPPCISHRLPSDSDDVVATPSDCSTLQSNATSSRSVPHIPHRAPYPHKVRDDRAYRRLHPNVTAPTVPKKMSSFSCSSRVTPHGGTTPSMLSRHESDVGHNSSNRSTISRTQSLGRQSNVLNQPSPTTTDYLIPRSSDSLDQRKQWPPSYADEPDPKLDDMAYRRFVRDSHSSKSSNHKSLLGKERQTPFTGDKQNWWPYARVHELKKRQQGKEAQEEELQQDVEDEII